MYKQNKAFTLIELLVVIAIIAILSIVVVLTVNPSELLRQSRDQNRLSDMDTLTHALSLYQTDAAVVSGSGSLGSVTTVYVSLPDPTASTSAGSNCTSLNLPALPTNYAYHCAGPNFYRKTDSTGWIPVNFSGVTTGSPLGSLPVDPQNTASSRLYYAYTTDGSKYEITSNMESAKYKLAGTNDQIANDGGTLASVYEKGSKLGLEPLDYGDASLVGLWTMDEGTGPTAYDYSGKNASGTWGGTAAGTNGYYSAGQVGPWAGTFDGTTTQILASDTGYPAGTSPRTATAWFTLSRALATTSYTDIVFYGTGSAAHMFVMGVANDTGPTHVFTSQYGMTVENTTTLVPGAWYFAAVTYDGTNYKLYLNGVFEKTGTMTTATILGGSLLIGNRTGVSEFFPGLIDDVRIYGRTLSAAEIQALYSGGK